MTFSFIFILFCFFANLQYQEKGNCYLGSIYVVCWFVLTRCAYPNWFLTKIPFSKKKENKKLFLRQENITQDFIVWLGHIYKSLTSVQCSPLIYCYLSPDSFRLNPHWRFHSFYTPLKPDPKSPSLNLSRWSLFLYIQTISIQQ